jgi:phage terminase large subunit GpA-like protein
MFNDSNIYQSQLTEIIKGGEILLSNIKPSEWVEKNVVMGQPFPGPYRYSKTPYAREIIDCLDPAHPAKWVAVMKGLQIGISSGVIIPGMGWIIKESPANTYFTVGAPDLVDKATEKLDLMIDGALLRDYIKPQVVRNRAQKSGDTNTKKDFAGGYIVITSANNHKNWRDVSLKYGFFDDFEAVKSQSKESGSTRKLIEGRFAAYQDNHKIFYISTPELKEGSNIEPAFQLGDQRKFLIPCPHCHEFIEWVWNDPKGGGIVWETDNHGRAVESSVGYVCQKCAGFFKDNYKHKMLNDGVWHPTVTPSQMGYYSYHISSLYAPPGMYDWKHYVNNYLEANPVNQPRKEAEHKTFVNTCLGLTYEGEANAPAANSIQKNCRNYNIGNIPEKLSLSDGNGRIILLTCAADMNGKVDDARLDYEIVAWSEKGASYSVMHGSIGTFIPREDAMKNKADREKWTYEENKPRSVWAEFDRIINTTFITDTGKRMDIYRVGLDCGYFSTGYAYPYVDRTEKVIGLKGDKEDTYIKFNRDVADFKPARERPKLYILQVGNIKDDLSEYMQLRWSNNDESQPFGFMNFPTPSDGQYTFPNYFEHFESEHCVTEANKDGKGIASRWQKKNTGVMNHMWDCRVYNIAVRDIVVAEAAKHLKVPKLTWKEFGIAVTGGG